MTSVWTGSLRDLRRLFQSYQPSQIISPKFQQIWGQPPQSQIDAWDNSLSALISALQSPDLDNVLAIIELQMPVGAERADCVLLGGTRDSPKALVIELKQWTGVDLDEVTGEVYVPGQGIHTHPSLQALNYCGKLRFYNAVAKDYEIYGCAFLHHATEEDRSRLSGGIAGQWVKDAPILIHLEEMEEYVRGKLLPAALPDNEATAFANAPFAQSPHLFDFIGKWADAISHDAESILAGTGMGLTEEQRKIKNEVKQLLVKPSGGGTDIIVNGRPGSGKTLLAVSILMMAFQQGRSCLFALRNNRLQAVLKQIFDDVTPGLSGFMVFFEPRNGVGIAQFDGHVDVLICDEAQRMEKRIMPNVLPKADISVIFLDESQRLNPPEQGTVSNFASTSRSLGRNPIIRELPSLVRCTGGQDYLDWVEALLKNPADIPVLCESAKSWQSAYELRFSPSVAALLSDLRQRRSAGRVALVASFTESPGCINDPHHRDNLRVGFPLTSGFSLYQGDDVRITWLMSKSEYRRFWIEGECNKLERVASIYGCQGFEADYVGVIWGRDLLYRNGKWVLGNPNYCYDTINKLVTGRIPNRKGCEDALTLVLNRYRIFLIRGIKRSMVFCEDEETRKYLADLGRRMGQ